VESSYPLTSDVIIIGRGQDCNICINDLYMSNQNTQLWFEDKEWYIADMGSTNGTFINGEKMTDEPLILDSGDRIRIGQVEFVIVIVGE
ncbi:MAG: FHA domain-containing protein, partial [Clostridia bacterium]|nr:FHA domain-containing protein [Clostridia bacterium]